MIFFVVVALISLACSTAIYLVYNVPSEGVYDPISQTRNPAGVESGKKVIVIGLAVAFGLLILSSVTTYLTGRLRQIRESRHKMSTGSGKRTKKIK